MNNKSQYSGGVSGLHEFVIRPGGACVCPSCHRKTTIEIIEVHTAGSERFATFRRSACCMTNIWTAHKLPSSRSGKTAEKTIERVAMLIKEQSRDKYELAEAMGMSKWTVEKAVYELQRSGKVVTMINPTRYVWNA